MPTRSRVPQVVLISALLMTFAFSGLAWYWVVERNAVRFQNAVEGAHDRVLSRLELYVALLRGGQGLFAASNRVTEREFRLFVERLDIPHLYPGVQGIGFSERLPNDALSASDGVLPPEGPATNPVHVWPRTPRDEYHAIVYLEPLDKRNQAAIGYDMFTEPIRREAMGRARDTGEPALSGRVTLVQEIEGPKQPGFLIYAPVYEGGSVPATVEERRQKLQGFVYAPFRAGDLFKHLFGTEASPRVAVAVYDGEVKPENLLYDEVEAQGLELDAPRFRRVVPGTLGGRTWSFAVRSLPVFEERSVLYLPSLILGIGLLVSAALFFLSRTQALARENADRVAAENEQLFKEAQEAVRLRDEFLSIASHELKTPLTSLSLRLEMLERKLPPEAAPTFQVAQRQIKRLSSLVGDLLDVSRITAGRLELVRADTDLSELVRDAAARFEATAARSGNTLEVRTSGSVTGYWDAARLEQVVTNLIDNALKYAPGSTITLSARERNGLAELCVEDQGIGIPEDRLPYIFGRFERAVSGRNYGGLGLGLFITRQIVTAHGGDIRVESTPGHTVFTVELPLKPPVSTP